MRIKSKEDENCFKMLNMIREKFKVCQNFPTTHTECQSFKISFCTAYSNFPCCVDVIFYI